MDKIIVLDGYELNKDLEWKKFDSLGETFFYDRTLASDAIILERIGDANIVITHKTPLNANVIKSAPNLKYIGIMGTGYDVVDIDTAHNKGIVVTNVPTYASDAVAQFTIALLLEITSQVGLHNHLVHSNKWSEVPDFTFWDKPLIELKGKTLGLIGYGKIAKKVAEIAHSFSMKVIFYNHRPKNITEKWLKQVSLEHLFKHSDVISLHVIQAAETVNLINRNTISEMKDNVIILNTARGNIINEYDIAEALKDRKVYALGTDVVGSEPILKDNPLLKAPNCYITPHIAWASLETRERLLDITVSNLKSFLVGQPINLLK